MHEQIKNVLALLARDINVVMHAHHAVQLVISLDKPYPAVLNNSEFAAVRGFLIDSDIPHACQSAASTLLIMSVDADSRDGRQLRQRLGKQSFVQIEELLPESTLDNFAASYWKNTQNAPEKFDYSQLLRELSCLAAKPLEIDSRITSSLALIANKIETKFQTSEIARGVNLSESRLRHLFRAELGTSISSYILWTRIKIALKAMLTTNREISETAYLAGFSDHAHFTRIFKRMFGVPPSLLLKYVQCLQVFDL